jgi:hypothetical protein
MGAYRWCLSQTLHKAGIDGLRRQEERNCKVNAETSYETKERTRKFTDELNSNAAGVRRLTRQNTSNFLMAVLLFVFWCVDARF